MMLEFQTSLISPTIGQKCSYIPPLEIPKVWWGGVISFACVDISLRIGALLAVMGLKWQDKSSQIWRQPTSDTWESVLIANHHPPPPSKKNKNTSPWRFWQVGRYTTAIYIITLKILRHLILYSMGDYVGTSLAASVLKSWFYVSKTYFWSHPSSAKIANNRYHSHN
jgi:hypothetical protein